MGTNRVPVAKTQSEEPSQAPRFVFSHNNLFFGSNSPCNWLRPAQSKSQLLLMQ